MDVSVLFSASLSKRPLDVSSSSFPPRRSNVKWRCFFFSVTQTVTHLTCLSLQPLEESCGDHLVPVAQIERMLITLRGVQVIVDRDLVTLHGVETKALNQAVRRNLNRFPSRFRSLLTKEEVNKLVTKCNKLLSIKYSPALP